MFLAVQILVPERPRVQPLHKVLEEERPRFGELHARRRRFDEAVRRVERGGEEGRGRAEDFAVHGEDGFAGADGDVHDGFEELADGDVGFGSGRRRHRCR